jgi:hypothetical protein
MPFTALDFRNAIDQGNIASVEAILNERDANTGVPWVDINHISDNPFLRTALNYTLASRSVLLGSEARYEIALRILGISDRQNNPVIDPNVPNGTGQTSFSWLQSQATAGVFSPIHARVLSQRILNLRYADGSRVFDFAADTSTQGLLVQSVLQGDPFIVNELVDLREADGSRTLSINRTYHWNIVGLGWTPSTALDVALRGSYWNIVQGYVPNQEIVQILRENGGRRAAELNGQDNVLIQIPPPVHMQPPLAGIRNVPPQVQPNGNIEMFNANVQNVHDAHVENSVDCAIRSLCLKYYSPHYFEGCHPNWKSPLSNVFEECLRKIEAYINTCKRPVAQKERIQRGFRYISVLDKK